MHNFQMMKFQWKFNFELTVTVYTNLNQFIGKLNVMLFFFDTWKKLVIKNSVELFHVHYFLCSTILLKWINKLVKWSDEQMIEFYRKSALT